jgi:hypothetical protein
MRPKRLTAIVSLLLCLLIPSTAMSGPAVKEVEVNGVRLQYWDQGSGEPVVFVHGVISDHRAWEPVRDEIARKYRFIALTQRYFGTGSWKDDGKEFSVATFSNDLAQFITSLNAGPVHLVGWSFGGTAGHHMRHAEESHPTDAGHARGENADILRDDHRGDRQVRAGGQANRSSECEP